MHPFEVLEQVEQARGKNAKIATLKEGAEQSPMLTQFLARALHPYVHFGFTRAPERNMARSLYKRHAAKEIDMVSFRDLLDRLGHRIISGNAAKAEVEDFFRDLGDRDYKWAGRILTQNLRIGLDGEILKIWPDLVPQFKVMLSHPFHKFKGERVFPRLVSPKLDGVRVVAIHRDGEVTLQTREGRPVTSLPHIAQAIGRLPDGVYDGEAYWHQKVVSEGFNKFVGLVTCDEPHAMFASVEYHMFDALTLEEWDSQKCARPFRERYYEVQRLCANVITVAVPHRLCHTEDEVSDALAEFLSQGYEGAMDKDPEGCYEWRRSMASLKHKNFIDAEFTCVGHFAGEGKRAGTVGGLIFEIEDGTTFKVGSGFTDEDLQAIAANPLAFPGRSATIKYYEDPGHGVPRWPVFKAWRKGY